MEPLGPTLLLLARLIVMGPDGTRAISEHHARIPFGATGLLRETLQETGFPGALALRVTPAPRASGTSGTAEVAGAQLLLRAELWIDARAEEAGKPPDEVDTETVDLEPGVSRLVQLAENIKEERRLLVSFRALSGDELPTPEPSGNVDPDPREVSFRVDAYKDKGGARELLSTHLLRTLVGLPVSCQSSWKTLPAPGTPVSGPPDEELSLTIRPLSPQDGWISVEATLSARLLPRPGSSDPLLLYSTVTRTVSIGLPFDVSVQVPGEGEPKGQTQDQLESFVVQVTPYLSPPAPSAH